MSKAREQTTDAIRLMAEMRLRGYPWRQIAEVLGYSSERAVYQLKWKYPAEWNTAYEALRAPVRDDVRSKALSQPPRRSVRSLAIACPSEP